MITTVTLNAAIDKLYTVESFSQNSISRVENVNNTAGGKGINVARVANILGEKALAAGIICGFTGDYLISLLDKQNISHFFTRGKGETRCCINIYDKETCKHTEILEPGPFIDEETKLAFLNDYKKLIDESDIIAISGSLPSGLSSDFYSLLIKEARAGGRKVFLDTSGKALEEGIKAEPHFIKPNADEIKYLTGKDITCQNEAIYAAEALRDKGIESVVVSLGSEGAVMSSCEGNYKSIIPKLKTVNTVGCGDSMVAGFAFGIERGLSWKESFLIASCASCANALNKNTGFFLKEDFEKLLKEIKIEKM